MNSQTVIFQTIKKIVSSNLPNRSYKVFIFGSRAVGCNRPFSDIDVGVLGPKPVSPKAYVELVGALEESDIPYRADIVDFSVVSDAFKKQALASAIEL